MYMLPDDPFRIVVTVSNVDAQMRRLSEYGKEKSQSLTYANISQALAADYIFIYYVNMETGAYRKNNESQNMHI